MLLSSHLVTDMETIEHRQCSITSVLRAREMTRGKGFTARPQPEFSLQGPDSRREALLALTFLAVHSMNTIHQIKIIKLFFYKLVLKNLGLQIVCVFRESHREVFRERRMNKRGVGVQTSKAQ